MTPTETVQHEKLLKDQLNDLRHAIQRVASHVILTKEYPVLHIPRTEDGFDGKEVIDNIKLSYRHLEDAKMRLGKALQALDGGVSIYDKARDVLDQQEDDITGYNTP